MVLTEIFKTQNPKTFSKRIISYISSTNELTTFKLFILPLNGDLELANETGYIIILNFAFWLCFLYNQDKLYTRITAFAKSNLKHLQLFTCICVPKIIQQNLSLDQQH